MRRRHAIFTLTLTVALLASASSASSQGISQLQQFTSTTSPSSAITQTIYGKPLKLSGYNAGNLCIDANGMAITTGCSVSGASYPFPLTGNATSTLTQFNGGLTALASSTIGSGTQTGGLTISGGATTTGNAYFVGNVGIGSTTPTSRIGVTHTTNSLVPLLTATGFDNDNQWTPVGLFNESGTPTFVVYMPGILNSTGNIGLGTSTPQARLTVDHNSTAGTVTNGILINDSDTGTTWSTTVPGVVLDFGSNDTSGTGYGTRVRLGSVMETTAGGSSRFGLFTAPTTAGTMVERLSVLSGGNVGIGTTSPTYKLSVEGSSTLGNQAIAGYFTATSSTASTFAGNVGIGSTSPAFPLSVLGGPAYFQVSNNAVALTLQRSNSITANTSINFKGVGVDWYTGINATGNYAIRANNSAINSNSVFEIASSTGNVGIGTTSPSGLFSVQAAGGRYFTIDGTNARTVLQTNDNSLSPALTLRNTLAGAGNGVGIPFQLGYGGTSGVGGTATQGGRIDVVAEGVWDATAANQDSYMKFTTTLNGSAGEVMRLTSTGNVGIGTTSPYSQLTVWGGDTSASTRVLEVTNSASTTVLNLQNNGALTGTDATNNFTGRISPTRSFVLGTGTTTTFTGTTTGAYVPSIVMPFAGTLRQTRCQASTTQAFLGVQVFINTTSVSPSYFVSSSTKGTVKFTANNTFSAGDTISAIFGTTTSDANAVSDTCTFDVTETP